ncbi:MAG: AAA family ATPase [Thermoplasmata archaeon]|nr:AAA family ATPase [Thermoplasmata archaeon]
MNLPLVVVGGPPGSGKTTAARAAAERLGLEFHSAGALFRAQAERHNMDLGEFSRYAAEHPEVDRELDAHMLELARPGRLLEARLTGPLAQRKGIPVVYLLVTAREDVRAQRIAGRDGIPVAAALRAMLAREASEKARYQSIYGIDLDRAAPDLRVDSSDLPPAAVVDQLVDFIRRHAPPARP